jgi:hypothetical protein
MTEISWDEPPPTIEAQPDTNAHSAAIAGPVRIFIMDFLP